MPRSCFVSAVWALWMRISYSCVRFSRKANTAACAACRISSIRGGGKCENLPGSKGNFGLGSDGIESLFPACFIIVYAGALEAIQQGRMLCACQRLMTSDQALYSTLTPSLLKPQVKSIAGSGSV